jgi:hypothetical protein
MTWVYFECKVDGYREMATLSELSSNFQGGPLKLKMSMPQCKFFCMETTPEQQKSNPKLIGYAPLETWIDYFSFGHGLNHIFVFATGLQNRTYKQNFQMITTSRKCHDAKCFVTEKNSFFWASWRIARRRGNHWDHAVVILWSNPCRFDIGTKQDRTCRILERHIVVHYMWKAVSSCSRGGAVFEMVFELANKVSWYRYDC